MMREPGGQTATPRRRATARRTRLEVLTDHALNAADALEAIVRLKSGSNGSAVKQLVTALEREVRDALAAVTRRRRR